MARFRASLRLPSAPLRPFPFHRERPFLYPDTGFPLFCVIGGTYGCQIGNEHRRDRDLPRPDREAIRQVRGRIRPLQASFGDLRGQHGRRSPVPSAIFCRPPLVSGLLPREIFPLGRKKAACKAPILPLRSEKHADSGGTRNRAASYTATKSPFSGAGHRCRGPLPDTGGLTHNLR